MAHPVTTEFVEAHGLAFEVDMCGVADGRAIATE